MKKMGFLSLAAAAALLTSISITGCGNGCATSSSEQEQQGGQEQPQTQPYQVTVSDEHVLGARVYIGNALGTMATETGNGVYEFANGEDGPFYSEGGYNDVNGNGIIDPGEPKAPNMRAPKGAKNINPFQEMIAEGKTLDDLKAKYPSLQGLDNVDFDVEAESADNLDLMKDVAKAAIELAYAEYVQAGGETTSGSSENGGSTSGEESGNGQITPPSPGSEQGTTEASNSSEESNTSEESTGNSEQITPPAPYGIALRDAQITPPAPGSSNSGSSEATDSGSATNDSGSSSDQITPPSPDSGSTGGTDNGGSAGNAFDLAATLAAIDAAESADEVKAIKAAALAQLLGAKEGSSEADNSSEGSGSTTCLPGQECNGSTSSEDNTTSEGSDSTGCLPGQECNGGTTSEDNTTSESSGTSSGESSSTENSEQITPPAPGA